LCIKLVIDYCYIRMHGQPDIKMWELSYSSIHSQPDFRRGWVASFTTWPLYPQGQSCSTYWIGGWFCPTASLDAFGEKKTLLSLLGIWRLLGCLASGMVTILTELFRLPSAVRRKRIMCSKFVTSVVFVFCCVCTKSQSPGNSVRVNCSNCWKNICESVVIIWLCWRNINFQKISYGHRKLQFFFDFPTTKLGTYRCIKSSKKIHPLIRKSL
jgi:hypothetical protein